MTVVNPKSISGINSITMASGSDNLLTIHTTNTTERVRINSSGDVIVGSGITVSPDGDIFATGVTTATSFVGDGSQLTGVASTENIRTNTNATFLQNVTVVGTSTVTGNIIPSSDSATDIGTNSVRFQNAYVDTYYGNGANLTGITGTTINNNADNRLITGSGTANTLEGESTLTYDASLLNITSTTQGLGLRLKNTANEYTNVQFDAARTSAGAALGIMNAKWNNNHEVAAIYLTAGDDTTNKDDGTIKFYTSEASGSIVQRLNIDNNGNVSIGGIDPVATNSYYNKASLHIHQTGSGSATGSQIRLTSDYTGSATGDGSQLSIYSSSLYINNQENGSTYFYNNGSPTVSILANGNFGVGTQAPTKKLHVNGDILATSIYLGGSDSANQLDDYEEGTFNPTISDSSGNNSTFGSITAATYTKIGNTVRVSFRAVNVQTSGLTGSDIFYVKGLPFTTSNKNYSSAFIRTWNASTWGAAKCINFAFIENDQVYFMSDDGSTNGGVTLKVEDMTHNASDVFMTAIYQTSQ